MFDPLQDKLLTTTQSFCQICCIILACKSIMPALNSIMQYPVHTGRQLASDIRRDELSIRPDCNCLGLWTQKVMSLLLLLSNMPMCSFHDRAIARKVETKGSTVVFHVDQGRSFLITFTTGFVYAASSIHEKIQSLHKVPHFLKGSRF